MARMFKNIIGIFLVFTMFFSAAITTVSATASVENTALADRVNAEIELRSVL